MKFLDIKSVLVAGWQTNDENQAPKFITVRAADLVSTS